MIELPSEKYAVAVDAVPNVRDLALDDLLCDEVCPGLGMTKSRGW